MILYSFRILFDKKSKIYYNNNDDDRDNFPNEIIIKKTESFQKIFPKKIMGKIGIEIMVIVHR